VAEPVRAGAWWWGGKGPSKQLPALLGGVVTSDHLHQDRAAVGRDHLVTRPAVLRASAGTTWQPLAAPARPMTAPRARTHPRISHAQPLGTAYRGIWLHALADCLHANAFNWGFGWWQVLGSNQRRLSRRDYRHLRNILTGDYEANCQIFRSFSGRAQNQV
jgi:hypothetical protein